MNALIVIIFSEFIDANLSVIGNIYKGMLVVTMVAQWHYILNVVNEMATSLGIRILHVKDNVSLDNIPNPDQQLK